MDIVAPRSVVDVGCGSGAWLSVFETAGVQDLVGLEVSPVDPEIADVSPYVIQACDLSEQFYLSRDFDLALSLEVAEYLPEKLAASFIESLTRLAPLILFSAAVPGQMGVGHVNEQWPTYWCRHFSRFGFKVCDCLRDHLWLDRRVEWWYRQNLLLFVRAHADLRNLRLDRVYLLDRAFPVALDRKMPLTLQGPVEDLLPGDRHTPVPVTAGIVSNGGPERLAMSLRSIAESGFADQIVVCLDRDAPSGSREAALPYTKDVYDIESRGFLESALKLLASHCSGEYVLRVDDDECLGGVWRRDAFDGLALTNLITHFWLPRRWIIYPGDLFLSNYPWFPDLQLRIFRNDPRLISWPRQPHEHMKVKGRGMVLADRCIDHWVLVTESRRDREQKCERYRSINPEKDLSHFYLYEDHESRMLKADQKGLHSAILASATSILKPKPAIYNPGQALDFRSGGNSDVYVSIGWSQPEPWGTWTDGAEAHICLVLEEPFRAGAKLHAMVSAFVSPSHPVLRVEVECDSRLVAVWVMDQPEAAERSAIVPPGMIDEKRVVQFCFRMFHPASPDELGHSNDRRLLGLGFIELRIDRM
jgi:hypothetical protein